MKTLDEIGIFHQTDKASQFTRTYAKPHDYLRHVEPFFAPLRLQPVKLVEIGAAGGESIRTWLDYFPSANVFGVDIVQGTNPYNTVGSGVNRRYKFTPGDQGEDAFWKQFVADNGPSFNIVVDDGSHYSKDIITTWQNLWPHVAPGGVYVIEDLGVAYGGLPFTSPGFPNHMDWVKNMLDALNNNQLQMDRLHYSRELCILEKRHV